MGVIARRLKEARKASGLSQEKLGVLAGIDESSSSARVNQYEREKHIPDPSMMERFGQVLNVPLPYFYAEDDALAALLIQYHRMSGEDKQKVTEFVAQLHS
jgi:transcriptional regulator with XRE-family HTH domain